MCTGRPLGTIGSLLLLQPLLTSDASGMMSAQQLSLNMGHIRQYSLGALLFQMLVTTIVITTTVRL